jgi:hypothetical protein
MGLGEEIGKEKWGKGRRDLSGGMQVNEILMCRDVVQLLRSMLLAGNTEGYKRWEKYKW